MAKKEKVKIFLQSGTKKILKGDTDLRVSKKAVESAIETGEKYMVALGEGSRKAAAEVRKKSTIQDQDVKFASILLKPETYKFTREELEKAREKKPLTAKQLAAYAKRKLEKAKEAKKKEAETKKEIEKKMKKLEKVQEKSSQLKEEAKAAKEAVKKVEKLVKKGTPEILILEAPEVKKPEAKKPEIKVISKPEVKKPEAKKPEVKKPEKKVLQR